MQYKKGANMNWKFMIDTREQTCIEYLHSHVPEIEKIEMNYTIVTLDVGDFCITCNDHPIVCIERKAVPDFYQSLRDGRYREQKIRFKTFDAIHKMYIIEGNDLQEQCGLFPPNHIDHLMIRMMLKDNIKLVRTGNIPETMAFLQLLYSKLQQQPELYESSSSITASTLAKSNSLTDYVNCVSIHKKSNLTPEVCFQLQLRQIPGVSESITNRLIEVATSWKDLIPLLQHMGISGLQELKYTTKTGSRKIGPATATKIFTYLNLMEEKPIVDATSTTAVAEPALVETTLAEPGRVEKIVANMPL